MTALSSVAPPSAVAPGVPAGKRAARRVLPGFRLTLGYTVPKTLYSKLSAVQRLRVYVTAQNLFTITGYKGFDPELGNQGGSFGVDRGVYPQARVLMAGLNLGF
jgi:hypothetical protein